MLVSEDVTLTHVRGFFRVDAVVGERPPFLTLSVLLDLDRVVEDLGGVRWALPPQDVTSGLLGQGQVGCWRRPFAHWPVCRFTKLNLVPKYDTKAKELLRIYDTRLPCKVCT